MPASHRRRVFPAGPGHPRVRQFQNIKHNRTAQPKGRFALEGTWAVRAALEADVGIEVVFVCPDLVRGDETGHLVREAIARGASAFEVSERVVRRMVDREGPDGVAAIAHLPERRLGDLRAGTATRLIIADSFELAGNLGTIIRCADGAGAAAVLLTERRVRVNHPLVIKASMGTVFSLPVVEAERADALAWLQHHKCRIIAADPLAATSYREADYAGPVAIVMGSERYGLAPFWKEHAHENVAIPMLGVADSLNVGHAAALLLYEALAQHARVV